MSRASQRFPAMGVAGLGLVGPFGCGADPLLRAAEMPGPETTPEDLSLATSHGDRCVGLLRAQTSDLTRYVDKRALRRVNQLSRLTLLAICQALEDAGLAGKSLDATAIIVATGLGAAAANFAFMDTIIDDGDTLASPTLFSTSVANVAAASTAAILGAQGPNATVSQFGLSLASGLLTAAAWLAEGRAETAVLCAVDDLCPFMAHCAAETAQDPDAPLLLGEAASAFVLTCAEGRSRHGHIGRTGRIVHAATGLPPWPERSGPLYLSGSGRDRLPAPLRDRARSLAPQCGHSPALAGLHLALALLRNESACVLDIEDTEAWGEVCCTPEDQP